MVGFAAEMQLTWRRHRRGYVMRKQRQTRPTWFDRRRSRGCLLSMPDCISALSRNSISTCDTSTRRKMFHKIRLDTGGVNNCRQCLTTHTCELRALAEDGRMQQEMPAVRPAVIDMQPLQGRPLRTSIVAASTYHCKSCTKGHAWRKPWQCHWA